MKLSRRLESIISEIPKNSFLVDIGTDHGLIPIESILRGITTKSLATDVRDGPINAAKKNIIRRNFGEVIELRKGSGLEPVKKSELDSVVIAGMGGLLICELLNNELNKAKKVKKFIIQPMNSTELVREWIYKNGFNIEKEVLSKEDRRIYTVVISKYIGVYNNDIDDVYNYVSKYLIDNLNKDPLVLNYIKRIVSINRERILGMQKAKYPILELEKLKKVNCELIKIIK